MLFEDLKGYLQELSIASDSILQRRQNALMCPVDSQMQQNALAILHANRQPETT